MKLWQYRLSGIAAGLVVGSILVLGLTACDSQAGTRTSPPRPFDGATVQHDDQRAVTCWVYSSPNAREGGISCLPDWMLTPVKPKPVADKCLIKDLGESEACIRLFAESEPQQLPAPTWPTGRACDGNTVCIGMDSRRRALAGDGVSP